MHRKFSFENSQNELKGYNTTLEVKKYFYRQLMNTRPDEQEFEIYTIVIDKHKVLPFIEAIPDKDRLYNVIAKEILKHVDFSLLEMQQVILFADSCKGSKKRKIFDDYIKFHIEDKLPLKTSFDITHKLSHEVHGLQAVDLFCYGIVRKYSQNDTVWYDCFADKIAAEIVWEPKEE